MAHQHSMGRATEAPEWIFEEPKDCYKKEGSDLETRDGHHIYVAPYTNGKTLLGQDTQLNHRISRNTSMKSTFKIEQHEFPNRNWEVARIIKKSRVGYETYGLPRYHDPSFRSSESNSTSCKPETYPDKNPGTDKCYKALEWSLEGRIASEFSKTTDQLATANPTLPISTSCRAQRPKRALVSDFDRVLNFPKDVIFTDRERFEFRSTIPPRVPEVPRLLTPELEPIYEQHEHFCPCCEGYENRHTKLDWNEDSRRVKMDTQLRDAKSYIASMAEQSGR